MTEANRLGDLRSLLSRYQEIENFSLWATVRGYVKNDPTLLIYLRNFIDRLPISERPAMVSLSHRTSLRTLPSGNILQEEHLSRGFSWPGPVFHCRALCPRSGKMANLPEPPNPVHWWDLLKRARDQAVYNLLFKDFQREDLNSTQRDILSVFLNVFLEVGCETPHPIMRELVNRNYVVVGFNEDDTRPQVSWQLGATLIQYSLSRVFLDLAMIQFPDAAIHTVLYPHYSDIFSKHEDMFWQEGDLLHWMYHMHGYPLIPYEPGSVMELQPIPPPIDPRIKLRALQT